MPALDLAYCNDLALRHNVQFVTPIFQSDPVAGLNPVEQLKDAEKQKLTGSDHGFCSAVVTEWLTAELAAGGKLAGAWGIYAADPGGQRQLMYAIQMGNTNIRTKATGELTLKWEELVAKQQKRDLHQLQNAGSLMWYGTYLSQVAQNARGTATVTDGDLQLEWQQSVRENTDRKYQLTFYKSYDDQRPPLVPHEYPLGTTPRAVLEDVDLGLAFIELHMDNGGHAIGVRRRPAHQNTSALVDANSGIWVGAYGDLVAMFEDFWKEMYAAVKWVAKGWTRVQL